jgi:hypothetical protein
MKLDVVMPICNHSIHQAEARRLWVQSQPGLHSETLSQILLPTES